MDFKYDEQFSSEINRLQEIYIGLVNKCEDPQIEYQKIIFKVIESEGYELLTSSYLTSSNILYYNRHSEIPNCVLIHKDGIFINAWINIDIEDSGFDDQIEYEFNCLHCGMRLYDFHQSDFSENCEECNWKNELIKTYNKTPVIVLYDRSEPNSTQICYPEIIEADLEELPEQLKNAVTLYFEDKGSVFFSNKLEKQIIYHNLFKKDPDKFEEISIRYKNKAKLARFFQSTDLFYPRNNWF